MLGLSLTVAAGVTLGYMTYRIARTNEQQRVELQFREIANREAAALEGEVVELSEVLHSIRAFYDSSARVDADEFRTFAEGPLRRHPTIQAVAWVPAVPDNVQRSHERVGRTDGIPGYRIDYDPRHGYEVDGRRVFYPVYHVHPREPGDLPVGRDIASEPPYLAALRTAIETRAPTLSDPVPSKIDGVPQVLMLLAVFGDAGPAAAEPRLRGVVTLMFRPEQITAAGFYRRGDMELELAATDRFGFEHPLVQTDGFVAGAPCCEVGVEAVTQHWRFRAVPTVAYIGRWSTPNPILFGVVAAALWLGLAGVLILSSKIGREREIRRRDRNVRSVLASLEEGVVVADRDGNIVFANGAAGRILAMRPDRAKAGRCALTWGCHLDEARTLCREDLLPLTKALHGETVAPTQLFVENRHLPKGRWVSMSAGPLRDGRNGLSGAVAVLRDVTEIRRSHARRIEMQLASAVQRELYPRVAPKLDGYDLSGAVFSADATCGDYFDFVPVSERVVGIAIGDVSGHGLGPALVMTQVRAYLRAFVQTMDDPAKIVERMNRVLVEDLYEGYFVTLIVAFLDVPTGVLRYVNAGHVAGQLLDVDGTRRTTLDRTGLPLGLVGDRGYFAQEVQVTPGDTVLLMTDGLIECRNAEGDFLWDEGAVEIAAAHVDEPASDLVESIYERVRAHAGWQPLADDLAMVVLKALPDDMPDRPVTAIHRESAPGTAGTIAHRTR